MANINPDYSDSVSSQSQQGANTRGPQVESTDNHEGPSPYPLPHLSRHSSPLSRASTSEAGPSIFGATALEPSRPSLGAIRNLAVRLPAQDGTSGGPSNVPSVHLTLADAQATPNAGKTRAGPSRGVLPDVEKDVDDPSTPPCSTASAERCETTIGASLSKLFAAQVSPDLSRPPSFINSARRISSYSRNESTAEMAALPEHVYRRGFLEGRHSDITINVFGMKYKLHRLILDRAPYFQSALSAPWIEASASETTLHPEEMDPLINQASFELALKRLYGCSDVREEESEAVGLFATGCWLEMQDLVDSSIDIMLRQMTPKNLPQSFKLVTANYYGRSGEKIIASAKSMLCRDGWRMPIRFWDDIPGDVVREIVGSDGFYIDGEWERWVLTRKILDRRLKVLARDFGLVRLDESDKILKAPASSILRAVRFDPMARCNDAMISNDLSEKLLQWISLYTHPDVEPLLVLLDEGIHYCHLAFEQLQAIRATEDVLGLPVVSERIVANALWQQLELRQTITNIPESEEELGLSVTVKDSKTQRSDSSLAKETSDLLWPKHSEKSRSDDDEAESLNDCDCDLEGNGSTYTGPPRKFWIPSTDCTCVMGGGADPLPTTSRVASPRSENLQSLNPSQGESGRWASDFAAATARPRMTYTRHEASSNGGSGEGAPEARYTTVPPFRFAVEFENPRLLNKRKRVYSRTVFYAGSLWSVYIQKLTNSRSKQLGVYLHRAKEQEAEEVLAGTAGLTHGNVDERIGQLEREIGMTADRRQRRQSMAGTDEQDNDGVEHSESIGEVEVGSAHTSTLAGYEPSSSAHSTLPESNTIRSAASIASRTTRGTTTGSLITTTQGETVFTPDTDFESDTDGEGHATPITTWNALVPTLPPYVDVRPTIKTYFRIYSPSRGGRMLSVYESAPDTFNFSQSWGWKSSTLMLDEGMLRGVDDTGAATGDASSGVRAKSDGNDKLRFMVVIGNI